MITVKSSDEMKQIGKRIGERVQGGEVFELIGDVGSGKTTFVKGVGHGMQINEDVQSPSFTISRVYDARDDLTLYHYDFYRLADAGVLAYEFEESASDDTGVTFVEWAETVSDVLPGQRITIKIRYDGESEDRHLEITYPAHYAYLQEASA